MRRALAALLLLLAPGVASAERWVIDEARSSLRFSFEVNGIEATGRFPAFEGVGRFDPAAPEDTALSLAIDVAAVDVGPALADAIARSSGWFAAAAHPVARFELSRVTSIGPGRWRAEGVLEMRGVAAPMAAELRLEVSEARARAVGETVVARRRFGVGRGLTAALVSVSEDIRVRFDLVARIAERGG